MTSELKTSKYLSEFVSGGAKDYAYKIIDIKNGSNQPKTVCKICGIMLNYNASYLVNFDVFRDIILNREPDHIVNVHTENKIKRKRNLRGVVSIITEPEDKQHMLSFFKRRPLNDNNSVPFCYV